MGERKNPELNTIRWKLWANIAGRGLALEDKFDENGEGLWSTYWLPDTVLSVYAGLLFSVYAGLFSLCNNPVK